MIQTRILYLIGFFKGWPAGTPKHRGSSSIFHIERLMATFDEPPSQLQAVSAGVLHEQETERHGRLLEKIGSVVIGYEEWARRLAEETWSPGLGATGADGDTALTRIVSRQDGDLAQTLSRYRLSPLWLWDRSSKLWSGPSDFGPKIADVAANLKAVNDARDLARRSKGKDRRERSGFER